MKVSDNILDQAFKASAENLKVSTDPDLWERFKSRQQKKSKLSWMRLSVSIAASIAIVISASFFALEKFNGPNVVEDLAMHTTSEKYISYRDYLNSDQYAELRTSYEVLK